MTVQQAKIFGKKELSFSPTPDLDLSVILQWILKTDKTQLLLQREKVLTDEEEKLFLDSIQKRKTGFPVAYITGVKEFYGFDFKVTPDVLIPKPDTEILVDRALNYLGQIYSKIEKKEGLKEIPEICDMCSGSGCVGLSILKSLKENDCIEAENLPKVVFADISRKALDVAMENAEILLNGKNSTEYSKAKFYQSNLFENVLRKFNLIVTNPPYVPHFESIELLADGRSEPLLALDGDVTEDGNFSGTNDGLFLIKRLVPACFEHLEKGGMLLMETGEYNAEKTSELFEKAGFVNVKIHFDLNGMMRVVQGEKPF